MAYKIKYSRKEKKDKKKDKKDVIVPIDNWIDAREEYVFI